MSNLYGQSYQPGSPYASPIANPYVPVPPSPVIGRGGAAGSYIEPRSLVYVTTAGRDGQILYSLFRAEPSSYQTAQGRVEGIQWELVEVTPVMPVNYPPADRTFFNAWGPNGEKERQRMVEKWLFEQNAAMGRRDDASLRGGAPGRYPAPASDWGERQRRAHAQAEAQALAAAEEDRAVLREQERRGRRISSNPIYGSNAGGVGGGEYPPYTTNSGNRARSKSYSRYERADEELARALGKVDLDRAGYAEYEEQQRRERRRSMSRGPAGGGIRVSSRNPSRNPSPVGRLPDYTSIPSSATSLSAPGASNATRPRRVSFSATYPTAAEYSQGGTYSPYGGGGGSSPSYAATMGQQAGGGGIPLYPPGHILAGKPIPGLQRNDMQMQMGMGMGGGGGGGGNVMSYRSPSPRPQAQQTFNTGGTIPTTYRSSSPRPDAIYRSSSRSRSRAPSRVPSPNMKSVVASFSPPPSFFRPAGVAFPYTYFDPILVTSDLNRMHKESPSLPPVLFPHDVHQEDWSRCLNDIITSWFMNKQPSTTTMSQMQMAMNAHTSSITKKPGKMVAQLIDVWNASFFAPRGVEMTLYRGRQRCSGPQAGRYDASLDFQVAAAHGSSRGGYAKSSSSSSSDLSTISSDSEEDLEDPNATYDYLGYGTTSRYLPADGRWIADSRRAEKARKDARRVKARRQQEQLRKREMMERRRKEGLPYSIYLNCIGDGRPPRNALSDAASVAYAAALTGGRGY